MRRVKRLAQQQSSTEISVVGMKAEFDPIKDKVILVTGGTGSFGKQFLTTVLTRVRSEKTDRV